MKQYKLWVRLNQTQTAFTLVYAENAYAAKQLGEAQYGVGNVLNYTEVSCDQRKYNMRFYELFLKPIKPKPPLTPAQARINSLKQNVQRDKQQLKNEKERQRQQREREQQRKQLQQRYKPA